MKYLFSLLFLFCTMTTFGQASFPQGFKLIKGDNGAGDDDRYSNGKDIFQTHLYFRSYDDYTWNDDKFKQYVAEALAFHFTGPQIVSCGVPGKSMAFTPM
ncbi:hypothetical protein [Chitinophaga pinensis]|uniref:Uncharacterized protein n=1 Tax=Chitinophaga pinensis TaxID=79329 RepID=A0A5C6LK96_9BACT|nr:hypothetical protein [Chitinophaga pinensis]TWV89426.1 hypothetical protein FEF09_29935 [Chitinophaga pinensis]